MTMDAHHVQAGQVAAALGTAAQNIRENTHLLEQIDPALVAGLLPLLSQLDAAVTAVGKYAWAPQPAPQISAQAGGG